MTSTLPVSAVPSELVPMLDRLGVRYEVIDGAVVVSPSATFRHEAISARISAQLVTQAPPDVTVLGANYNFYYARPHDWFVCGDLMVARTADCGERGIDVAPLLMVEVLSPSSRRRDLLLKRELYAEAGVASYWLLDPAVPALTVLELRHGSYVETAAVTGVEVLHVTAPFPADLRLAA